MTTAAGFSFAPRADLRSRTSVKWRHFGPDVLPLFVAEMDTVLAPPVRDALLDAVTRSDTGYARPDDYVEALAGFARETWGWEGVVADRCLMVPDVMIGVAEILRHLTRPGSPVVVNPPVYAPFYDFVASIERGVVEVALGPDGRLDIAALDDEFARLRREHDQVAYLLCNPHNPTGIVHTHEELTSVAEIAARHRVRVVSDEIHAPLVYEGSAFVPYASVDPRGIAVQSASKGWNLAGAKAALAIAGEDAVGDLAGVPEVVTHGVSHLGVIAHSAAYREGRAWLADLLVALDSNRRMLSDLLAEHLPAAGYSLPDATYLAWLDCRALDLGSVSSDAKEAPAYAMLAPTGAARHFLAAGVATTAGEAFGTGGAGHVRLNFATSPDILTEAVTRMAWAVPGP